MNEKFCDNQIKCQEDGSDTWTCMGDMGQGRALQCPYTSLKEARRLCMDAMPVDDKNLGLYGKFKVSRSDGSSESGEKHEHCSYFVLDLTHDKFAMPALSAYAEACTKEFPFLAADLRKIVDKKTAELIDVANEKIADLTVKEKCDDCK